ncbi:flagellar hook-basal body complex protein FliE [Paenibacillus sp. FSL M7-1455]|jgi:flagellar hook-basal body complex protein FliE|uniref:Flagellar hook-basal body complex protein FliE n=1 Tax=Paenibacillus cookii TaxID=157839 RepID=A0ABQ4LU78_9BACL|nr:flagellar hook-basal body complex protein FliE [Paenibacillus cookii]KHF37012.1 Flagellar hook-basal body complex protein FliE [Paenibacillus sp. P1XP2]GIO66820.1 flagellar hook-basal body complex protein FliE [Paenibacillus cookii]HWO53341.1 flagellar hook-basal body complex protein FliE [Paenibacillus cookii]
MIQNTMFNTLNVQPLKLQETTPGGKDTPAESLSKFGTYLENAISQIADQEKTSKDMSTKFMLGQVDVDQVMISSEKALLSLQLASQVRNKVIEAYQEIMRTQI